MHQFVEKLFMDSNDNQYFGCLCEKCGFKVVAVPWLEEELQYYPDHSLVLIHAENVTPMEAEALCERLEVVCR